MVLLSSEETGSRSATCLKTASLTASPRGGARSFSPRFSTEARTDAGDSVEDRSTTEGEIPRAPTIAKPSSRPPCRTTPQSDAHSLVRRATARDPLLIPSISNALGTRNTPFPLESQLSSKQAAAIDRLTHDQTNAGHTWQKCGGIAEVRMRPPRLRHGSFWSSS